MKMRKHIMALFEENSESNYNIIKEIFFQI